MSQMARLTRRGALAGGHGAPGSATRQSDEQALREHAVKLDPK
jgi:hypothetical protein